MLKTVVFTLGIALAACSVGSVNGGDDDQPDGGGGVDPRAATFDTAVKATVMPMGCLNTGNCHGGTQNPKFSSFTEMTTSGSPGRYILTPAASNIIITKAADGATHEGVPYLGAAEKATISTWLETPQ